MENLVADDIVFFRALSKMIVDELSSINLKLYENCKKLAETYFETLEELKKTDSASHLQRLSNSLDLQKQEIVYNFSINEKIGKIIEKNETRLKFFDIIIANDKITNLEMSKKQIITKLEGLKIKLDDSLLNLNISDETPVKVFYNDMILELLGDNFRLDNEHNYEVLQTCEEKEFNMIMEKYPKCLMTISNEELLNKTFKHKILKEFVTIYDSKLKNKKFPAVNEFFGSPLEITKNEVSSIFEYVDKIKNLFNVRAKRFLLETYPKYEKDINSKLVCDEQDQTLPYNLRKVTKKRVNDYEDVILDPGFDSDSDESVDNFNSFLNELMNGIDIDD